MRLTLAQFNMIALAIKEAVMINKLHNGILINRHPGTSTQSFGSFSADVNEISVGMPVENAVVKIYEHTPEPNTLGKQVEELFTNENGQTGTVELPTPPIDLSLEPQHIEKPYAEYDIEVVSDYNETMIVKGVQVLPKSLALQEVSLLPINSTTPIEFIDVPPHVLWGDYPPKIQEDEVKPLPEPTGFVVLDQVVVPQYIIVHTGAPSDNTAKNYWVTFKSYIKNVACCEIYASWPESTIRANVLAIISFTLNRVFTEWYRNQGKNFTITNSTEYVIKWNI